MKKDIVGRNGGRGKRGSKTTGVLSDLSQRVNGNR
jgi:hypothetical protein